MGLKELNKANIDYATRFLGERHSEVAANIAGLPGVGLSFLKMSDDFETAKTVAFCLQACAGHNRRRIAALKLLCKLAGQENASERLELAEKAVRRHLGLIRSPIRHLGVELSKGQSSEIKVYLQTNISNEVIVGQSFQHEGASGIHDMVVLNTVGKAISLKDDGLFENQKVLTTAHGHGLGLDMIGLDVDNEGAIALKTYLAPPEGEAGLKADNGGLAIAEAFLHDLVRAFPGEIDATATIEFIKIVSLIAPSLAINQISIERVHGGGMKLKLYYDLWSRDQTFDAAASAYAVSFETFDRIINAFRQVGVILPTAETVKTWKVAARAGEMVLDAFALEVLDGHAKAKVYVRPADNQDGDGLSWPVRVDND
jgi:hypothetical protein